MQNENQILTFQNVTSRLDIPVARLTNLQDPDSENEKERIVIKHLHNNKYRKDIFAT